MNQKAFEILGDYTEFYTLQAQRLQKLGIDIDGLEVSHLAFRTETLVANGYIYTKSLTCGRSFDNISLSLSK